VGEDVSNGAVGSFTDFILYDNSTLWIHLLDFEEVLFEPFLSNQYGPIYGMIALPNTRHTILATDLTRSKVLRVDINSGGIEVANKDIDLPPLTGASCPTAVNGLKIFDDYFYFTSTGHQTPNRVKIDKSDHRIGGYEAIYKFDAALSPDDFVLAKDGKHLYAVLAGLGETVSGGQAIRNELLFNAMLVSSSNLAQKQTLDITHALQPIDTPLGTNTRLLISTKRCHRCNLKVTVDPNRSSIKTLGNSLGSIEVS